MPKAWSRKDEHQYQAIRKQQLDRGANEDKAEQIAASTVNKQRRKEGRTPNKTTTGTGNPNKPLDQRTRRELYNRARQLSISGRSNMNKNELVEAIRRKG